MTRSAGPPAPRLGALAAAGLLVLGLGLGAASAVLAIREGGRLFLRQTDGWTWSAQTGSPAADPYTRALTAKGGLLALSRAEAVYYNRTVDERGRPLTPDCVYELSGPPPAARWWSVTIYAEDDFLPVNGDQAASADATRTPVGPDGLWRVRVAAQRPSAWSPAGDASWISSRAAGAFALTLRLYGPAPQVLADMGSAALPRLKTLACASDGAAS